MNEETLLREIKDDPQKFGEIYDAFYGKIFSYAFKRTTDYHAARDIAAETFLKAYANWRASFPLQTKNGRPRNLLQFPDFPFTPPAS